MKLTEEFLAVAVADHERLLGLERKSSGRPKQQTRDVGQVQASLQFFAKFVRIRVQDFGHAPFEPL